MKQQVHTDINWMDRNQIIEAMERHGFCAHDGESTDDLRESLRAQVMDGTISQCEIPDSGIVT